MPLKLSPLIHIEIVVRDAEETFRFLHNVFGAEKIELEFAGLLDSPFMKIVHVGLGEVVLQLCQPIFEEGSHHEQLTNKGASIHNLTYFVENIEDTARVLESEGIPTIFSFPLDMIEWDKLLGPENTRSDLPLCYIMGTMEKIGFHLELAEAAWKEEPVSPVIFPAYRHPRPETREKVSPLIHIGVVVRDVEDTYQFLNKVFDSKKLVKEFTGSFENPLMKIIHVKLGNVILQYMNPMEKKGPLYQFLQDKGPGVHHLAFFTENVDEIIRGIKNQGIGESLVSPWDGGWLSGPEGIKANDQQINMINTMDILGFQIALKEDSRKGEYS